MGIWYVVWEALVGALAVLGNTLVIAAFHRERRLRRRTNYYIVSLAVADLLVGLLGIPCALLQSRGLPTHLRPCLFTLSLLVVLCTISIFSLVAVSVDRYWAILYPMCYSRNVRTKTAIYMICGCWVAGALVGFLPLFGWHQNIDPPHNSSSHFSCKFTKIMDYDFLVFLYLFTIVFPALLMAAFYAHIYSVVLKQIQQMVTVNGLTGAAGGGVAGGGSMLRVLGAARKREVKATKNLSIIVLFFIICWFPLYTINFVQAFCSSCSIPGSVMDSLIILSHLNSAGNPLLYAYHLTDFRAALRALLCGPPPARPDVPPPKRLPVYRIPNSTPKIPHRIFELDTPPQPQDFHHLSSTTNGIRTRYSILHPENGSRCSIDSNMEGGGGDHVTHSSPPTPTKPHVIMDPT